MSRQSLGTANYENSGVDLRVAAYLFVGKQDLLLTTRMSSTLHWQKPSLLRSNICRVGLQLALVFELLTAFRPTLRVKSPRCRSQTGRPFYFLVHSDCSRSL